MNRMILIALMLIMTSMACSKEGVDIAELTYQDFTHLKPEMKYATIVEQFGEPDKDAGSGIHIYVYELTDGTEIWIGYTDAILYARHMDSYQKVLHVIIWVEAIVVFVIDYFNFLWRIPVSSMTVKCFFGRIPVEITSKSLVPALWGVCPLLLK